MTNNKKLSLKYRNESDKCYGIAGMAICVVALDRENLMDSVSLDADPVDSIKFNSQFYFAGNQRLSAKSVWNELLDHYQLSVSLVISNVLCRSLIGYSIPLPEGMRELLLETVSDDGRDSCSLDDDEIRTIFNKSFNYLNRLFMHQGVQMVARQFADEFRRRRTMTQSEVIDQLKALQML